MGDESNLSALLRILLLIPIFLCITISVYTLYQYEKCLNPLNECDTNTVNRYEHTLVPEESQENSLNEETRRGDEIRREYFEIQAKPAPPNLPEEARGIARSYVVQKGDTLWGIAGRETSYGTPYLWPIIHWEGSNKKKIDDPDLIYPNQQFIILPIVESKIDDRPLKQDEMLSFVVPDEKIQEARHEAKTRGSWSLYDGK